MSQENCMYPSDPKQHCYYREPSVCTSAVWKCQTCGEWFCSYHWHETAKGRNVECAACESTTAKSTERAYTSDQKSTVSII